MAYALAWPSGIAFVAATGLFLALLDPRGNRLVLRRFVRVLKPNDWIRSPRVVGCQADRHKSSASGDNPTHGTDETGCDCSR